MGSGTKTKHQASVVAPSPPVVAAPPTDELVEHDSTSWIGIENATKWSGAGLGAKDAHSFIDEGIDDPEVAAGWYAAHFGPKEAGEWAGAGFAPDAAIAWSSTGFEPDEAKGAVEAGQTPTGAIAKIAVGLYGPAVADEAEEQGEEVEADVVVPVDDVAPIMTLVDSPEIPEGAWNEAVTPIPETTSVGDPRGVPLLIGGADLEDSSATIMAYKDTGAGPAHEVLFCKINEEAEQKLLEALAPTEEKLVEVEHEVTYTGRVPFDEEKQIYENLVTAAKSINHHMKAQDGIPDHTLERVAQMKQAIEVGQTSGDPQVAKMAAFYKPLVDALDERVQPGFSVPYSEGGKTPAITAFEGEFTKTVKEWVPDTSEGPTGANLLAASSRNASRIAPTIHDGVSTWDGKSRSPAKGKEYVIQLPNGYTAIYHPYSYLGQNLSSDDYSLRGRLELHAPGGEGHAKELVDVLGSMNIVNRPMNGAEAEWTYLDRNIKALGLESNPSVAKAITTSKALEDPVREALIYEHQHEAADLLANDDQEGFSKLVRRVTLEAEAAALPRQVRIVRDAFAKAVGISSGKELVEHPAYNPLPRQAAGRMVFDRFDVAKDQNSLQAAFSGKQLIHHVTGNNIADIFMNGAILASQERRRMIGVTKNVGMSESSDTTSGGAAGAFLRIRSTSSGKSANMMIWDEPLRLLKRSDWYGYNGDHFGAVNAASHHSIGGQTKSPSKVAGFSASNNEIIFSDGLDLLGDDAPSKVVCASATERDKLRQFLKDRGVTHLGAKAVDEVVVGG